MNLTIKTPDPFEVLTSTKAVLEVAKFVTIDEAQVAKEAKKVAEFIANGGLDEYKLPTYSGDREADIQRIFIESVMGFCYWAEKGKEKWRVDYPKGTSVTGGWYGLLASLDRAQAEGLPIFEASYLAEMDEAKAREIFRGSGKEEIPLLPERVFILRDVGTILLESFDGRAIKILEEAEYDAVRLVALLRTKFPNFDDVAYYNKKPVIFLKLASLCASSIDGYLKTQGSGLTNLDQICVFADYKLPQMLRASGVISYNPTLASNVDNYILLGQGSPEEVEIRAATIWGVELIRQQLTNHTPLEVGQAIWLMSQDSELQVKIKPYHRTYTAFY